MRTAHLLSLACLALVMLQNSPANAAAEGLVYAFTGVTDGALPLAGLIDFEGIFYGTTSQAGTSTNCTNGCGTIFSVDPTTGIGTGLYPFQGSSVGDGATPVASLINVDGIFYGTTTQGGTSTNCGTSGCGTVFSFDPSKDKEKVLYSFQGIGGELPDGANPEAELINSGGILYGTTYNGGSGAANCSTGCGTVFSFDPSTNDETVLYSFQGNNTSSGTYDGAHPQAALVKSGIRFYGTTTQGGMGTTNCSNGCGTVFSLSRKNIEKDLYNFQGGSDGAFPTSGLLKMKGFLYGTTEFGGNGPCSNDGINGCGTVYSLTGHGAETQFYAFQGLLNGDGAYPNAKLVHAKGLFWGTTTAGGDKCSDAPETTGCGTVYTMTTTGTVSIQWDFQGGRYDGASPSAPLLTLPGRFLYTTTSAGDSYGCDGGFGCGTLIEIAPK